MAHGLAKSFAITGFQAWSLSGICARNKRKCAGELAHFFIATIGPPRKHQLPALFAQLGHALIPTQVWLRLDLVFPIAGSLSGRVGRAAPTTTADKSPTTLSAVRGFCIKGVLSVERPLSIFTGAARADGQRRGCMYSAPTPIPTDIWKRWRAL